MEHNADCLLGRFEITAKDSVERDSWLQSMIAARDSPIDEQQNRKDWSKHKDGSVCLDAVGEADDAVQEAMNTDPSYDLDDTTEFQDFLNLTIRDLNGVDCRLGDVVANRQTLLVMANQFGAPVTKKFLSDLMKQWDAIEDLCASSLSAKTVSYVASFSGIQIVIVGTANPIAAGIFRKDFGLPPVVYADVERKLYRDLGCRRGFRWAYSPQAFSAMIEAVNQGHRASQGVGDSLQLGGVFLLSKEDGIAFQHFERYGGNVPDLSEMLPQLAHFARKRPASIWATPPALGWGEIHSGASKASPFNISDRTWHVERGVGDAGVFNGSSNSIVLPDSEDTSYRRFFFGNEHSLYTSAPLEEDEEGEVDHAKACVVACIPDLNRDRKILIFHCSGIHRRIIPAYKAAVSEKDAIQAAVQRAIGVIIDIRRVDPLPHLQDELLSYEYTQLVKTYKFGLLYCKDGQTDEADIYANSEVSAGFEEFLQFLGNRLPLRGWTGYKGGLDVKKDVSGTHAILSTLEENTAIFHVAPMIPLDKEPEQALLERKRHIGNDVVVVIFKEGSQQLDPSSWRSQFNHVFVIVTKDERKSMKEDGKSYYKVEVAYKAQCPVALPVLADPPLFEKGKEFHRFLMSKLINAERSTTRVAPVFKQKMDKMRGLVLRDCVQVFNDDGPGSKNAVLVSGRLKVRKSKSDASSSSSMASTTAMRIAPPSFIAAASAAATQSNATSSGNSGNSSPRDSHSVSFAMDAPRAGGTAVPNPPASTRKGRHSRTQSRDSNPGSSSIQRRPSVQEKEDIFAQLEADIATITVEDSAVQLPPPLTPPSVRDSPSMGGSSDRIEKSNSSPLVPSKRNRGDSERTDKKEERTRADSNRSNERERRKPPSRTPSGDKSEKSRIKAQPTIAEHSTLPEPISQGAGSSTTPPADAIAAAGATSIPSLEASLRELEAVEKQVLKAAEGRRARPTKEPSALQVKVESGKDAVSPRREVRKNKSFQQLQAQWRTLAAQSSVPPPVPSSSSGSVRSKSSSSSASLPLVHEADELFSVVQQVLAKVGQSDSIKRVVVVNSKDPSDKDLISLKPEIISAADLTKAIELSTGRKVSTVTFEGVSVRDKHLKLFNDKDQVDVTFA